jgi:hypothetical protein
MARDDRRGQSSISLDQFAERFGYMPATVTDHERHADGMTLITASNDPDANIEIYDDEREPHRTGNPPEPDE